MSFCRYQRRFSSNAAISKALVAAQDSAFTRGCRTTPAFPSVYPRKWPMPRTSSARSKSTAVAARPPARLAGRGPPRLVRDRGGRRARSRALLRLVPRPRPRRLLPTSRRPRSPCSPTPTASASARHPDRAPLPRGRRLPVICANQVPDHATIARFRVRHQEALAGLFGQVLGLCAEAGLQLALLAVDGSKFLPPPPTQRSAPTRSPPRDPRLGGQSTPPRTSATATPAATSCPSSSDQPRQEAPWLRRQRSNSRPSAPRGRADPARPHRAPRAPPPPPGRGLAGAARGNRAYEAYPARWVMRRAPPRRPAEALHATPRLPRARSTPPTPTPGG